LGTTSIICALPASRGRSSGVSRRWLEHGPWIVRLLGSLNRGELRDAEALLQLCAADRFVLSATALTKKA